MSASRGWKIYPDLDGPPVSPPAVVVQVKALECDLFWENDGPLSPWRTSEIA
jgi:hypothetical protein